ncbi:MAG TPA: Crp/Fnr family transcriptional regulator [Anaerolineaceae bacterium]|nr:Crp/Fnr family transcriptional regulator [Anaerolineaceae bacterium]
MVTKTNLVSTLQNIPWLMELKLPQIERLAALAQIQHLEQSEVLYNEGERVGCLYILLEGQISVENNIPGQGAVRILVAEALEIVGWSGMTPLVRLRNNSARALTPATLLCFDEEGLRNLCEEDHHIGYLFMRRISNLVARYLLTTRLQLTEKLVEQTERQLPPLGGE